MADFIKTRTWRQWAALFAGLVLWTLMAVIEWRQYGPWLAALLFVGYLVIFVGGALMGYERRK